MINNSPGATLIALSILLVSTNLVQADETTLQQQVTKLENRVQKLEKLLAEKFADDRWRDSILWSRIRQGMSHDEVRKLLGKPTREEQAIFTTWYYHNTSKDHSYVWFDEGKVLGWEGLEQKSRPTRRLKP